jgi:hypothetical protein
MPSTGSRIGTDIDFTKDGKHRSAGTRLHQQLRLWDRADPHHGGETRTGPHHP